MIAYGVHFALGAAPSRFFLYFGLPLSFGFGGVTGFGFASSFSPFSERTL